MGLGRNIIEISAGIGFCLGSLTVGYSAMNYVIHHNKVVQDSERTIYTKADGFFGHTRLTINDDGTTELKRNVFLRSIYYDEKDNDGKVDKISEYHPNGPSTRFDRKKHLNKFPARFQEADRDYRAQIQRFKPLMAKR